MSNFKVLDSIFVEAVDKFQECKQFGYLCSLLILNSNNLITDPQSKLLYKHFNYDSDLITILECLYEISETEPQNVDEYGLNYSTITFIYSQIKEEYGTVNGRESVHQSIGWAKSHQNGILGNINKFINCLNQTEFINKRKCQFEYIYNANHQSIPLLVYKTKDDNEIEICQRPGSHGLQIPGNIIVLSMHEDKTSNKKHGNLIHHDATENNGNLGVSSFEMYNNIFFFKLYEAYMNDEFFKDENFKKIYTSTKKDQNAIKIFISNNEDKSYLSFCPLNSNMEKSMIESIKLITSLIPFVPRSLLVNLSYPKCIVEILGYGTLEKYITSVYLDSNMPLAYQINKTTLDYASSKLDELKKDFPRVRFAMTSENFFIDKNSNENEGDQQISYPDISESTKGIFDPNHPSHLVLLVESDYENKPELQPLSLTSNKKADENRPNKHLNWNYDEKLTPLINDQVDDDNTTCLYICSPEVTFCKQPLFVYQKDGSTKSFKICKKCLLEYFKGQEDLQFMIDPLTKKIAYDKLNSINSLSGLCFIGSDEVDDNTTWPQIPLGQALYALISEKDELASYAKLWHTIEANFVAYKSPFFIHCPNHPDIYYRCPKKGDSLMCEHCNFYYHAECDQWHDLVAPCSVDTLAGVKRCPNCKMPVIKVSGSNRMACNCGKYWCYQCDQSPIFNTVAECYQHLQTVHGGYYT